MLKIIFKMQVIQKCVKDESNNDPKITQPRDQPVFFSFPHDFLGRYDNTFSS